jgi:hypothetical protein
VIGFIELDVLPHFRLDEASLPVDEHLARNDLSLIG